MNEKPIRCADALSVLRGCKSVLAQRYGVTSLGLFGSVARDQATENSDVDVVIRLSQPDLFAMVHIKDVLQQALGRRVDLVHYRERMNAFLKKRIDEDAVYV